MNKRVFFSKQGNDTMQAKLVNPIFRPLRIKVRSLKDQTLRTKIQSYNLTEDQVFMGQFENQAEVDAYIEVGVLEHADVDAYEVKPVSVVLLDENKQKLPLTSISKEELLVEDLESHIPKENPVSPTITLVTKKDLELPLSIQEGSSQLKVSESFRPLQQVDRMTPYSREEMDALLAIE